MIERRPRTFSASCRSMAIASQGQQFQDVFLILSFVCVAETTVLFHTFPFDSGVLFKTLLNKNLVVFKRLFIVINLIVFAEV